MIDVLDKIGVSDSYLKQLIEAGLTKVKDNEIDQITKIIIAKGKAGIIVNFVISK